MTFLAFVIRLSYTIFVRSTKGLKVKLTHTMQILDTQIKEIEAELVEVREQWDKAADAGLATIRYSEMIDRLNNKLEYLKDFKKSLTKGK